MLYIKVYIYNVKSEYIEWNLNILNEGQNPANTVCSEDVTS